MTLPSEWQPELHEVRARDGERSSARAPYRSPTLERLDAAPPLMLPAELPIARILDALLDPDAHE